MERASTLRALGNAEEASSAFEAAAGTLAHWNETPEILLSREALAGLTNLSALPYRGRSSDAVMLHAYRALSFLEAGNSDSARVALNAAYRAQRDAVERNAENIENARKEARENAVDVPAMLESSGLDKQLAQQEKDLAGVRVLADYVNPFATWLHGVYFLHAGTDGADAERARVSLSRVAAMYPMITFFGYLGLVVTLGVSVILAFCFFIFDQRVTLKDMLMSAFVILYPVAPHGVAMTMTSLYGMIPLRAAAAAAMLSDAIAYYAGSAIGGKKIFPKISPNKTYAGAIIGLIGGAGGAMIVYALFEVAPLPINAVIRFSTLLPETYILFYCLVGTAIAVVSEIGDLFASRIKRELGIKDFSHALGSHGGLLDRLDSMIYAVLFMAVVMEFLI